MQVIDVSTPQSLKRLQEEPSAPDVVITIWKQNFMPAFSFNGLLAYWSTSQIEASVLILLNTLGGLALGMIVGYERSFHGRAAGIRTYGLVCMASSALTVIVGFPEYWFGGATPLPVTADPTRVIQGIVTGIGFLGAGVIMREGLNISGLSTSASIWATSVIGILCGSGFYLAAITMTIMSSISMIWGGWLEKTMPSRHAVSLNLTFEKGFSPSKQDIQSLASQLGYRIAEGSTVIQGNDSCQEWHLIFLADSNHPVCIANLAEGIKNQPGLKSYHVAFARN
jgi:putative Mg2+ transporter-C (MgtC) family protein